MGLRRNIFEGDPVAFIRAEFSDRKTKNASYSLRAFARDLGIDHSHLSRVFSGDRSLSLSTAVKMARGLGLSNAQGFQFLQALANHKIKKLQ